MSTPTVTDSVPTDSAPRVDAITAEIIRGNLIAITDEMKTNLMRTAYNQLIYEAQDFTVGLFDANGDTISIGLGLPMFVGGLSQAIKAKLAFYGRDGIDEGDILLTNDPYIMGSHLNHMILTVPIFHDGELVAFASSMAHWLDVGGVLGGTTHDIFAEGLQMPMVKLFKKGKQDDELTRIIETNVRFSDAALGDLRAQVAAIRTGETRLLALLDRYGNETIAQSIVNIFDRSEKLAREAVANMPDGEYFGAASMDDDGVRLGVPVPIKVRVVIAGDQMTIDLSEVSPQVAGYFNSGATAGRSAAQVAFKCLTSPNEYPINYGSFRPVDVILPPGTVVSATKPAAMRWWMTYPMTIVDCVFRAVADALAEGSIAGHHADLAISNLYGTDPSTGTFYLLYNGLQGGGWGATRDKDGESATICINDGDTHNGPVEAQEAKNALVYALEYGLRQDSGGAGRTRGGLGTRQRWVTENAVTFDSFVERTTTAPWGIDGGGDGLANRVTVKRASESAVTHFANGKVDGMQLEPGDIVIVETGGGGGYGDAAGRDPQKVALDVQRGYVSVDAALRLYGVAVSLDSQGKAHLADDANETSAAALETHSNTPVFE
ncbi:hydantoinase B/oxoprolinase family protein [Subtercola lobariae]|uniref:5-oxoprolinase n=1 Tax=Subtercola lobariae TaxID=1588641 RepID=A0A917EZV0_9MICO|nr:hydantoinase B/oxoprolinase family protein [Subtercola lobariae]GGF30626.1 5-oxoprolinase [Subtercola lobariae]